MTFFNACLNINVFVLLISIKSNFYQKELLKLKEISIFILFNL